MAKVSKKKNEYITLENGNELNSIAWKRDGIEVARGRAKKNEPKQKKNEFG